LRGKSGYRDKPVVVERIVDNDRSTFTSNNTDGRLPIGAVVCVASMHLAKEKGYTDIILHTDDFRLPALALYLWRDLWAMTFGLWKLTKGRPDSGTRLLFGVVPTALSLAGMVLASTGVALVARRRAS